MSYENFPETNSPGGSPVRKNNNRSVLTGILIAALLGTWGYVIYDKNKTKQEKQDLTMQIVTSDSAKNELQNELNDAAARLDMLKTQNVKADSLISSKEKYINDLKQQIQKIINDKNATKEDLAKANRLIAELKGNIEVYTAQIDSLKLANTQLTQEKEQVTQQRDVATHNYDSAQTVIKARDSVVKSITTWLDKQAKPQTS